MLQWFWRRLVATALIQPLAWEPPYVAGAAQEMTKRQKKKNTSLPIQSLTYSSGRAQEIQSHKPALEQQIISPQKSDKDNKGSPEEVVFSKQTTLADRKPNMCKYHEIIKAAENP